MDKRKKILLQELYNNKVVLTGDYLSEVAGVSSRTIRKEMKLLAELLAAKGIELNSVSGVGYSVDLNSSSRLKEYIEAINCDQKPIPEVPFDRINYLIRKLLFAKGVITLEHVASELYISKTTARGDVEKVEAWLMKHNIKLCKKKGYGIFVAGDEIDIRCAIADCVLNLNSKQKTACNQILEQILKPHDAEKIDRIFSDICNEIPLHFTDTVYANLIIHISIAIMRILQGKLMKPLKCKFEKDIWYFNNIQDIRNLHKSEYSNAKVILNEIGDAFNLKFPETEIEFIMLHLIETDIPGNRVQENEKIRIAWDGTVKRILDEVNWTYGIDMLNDGELTSGLITHFDTMLKRLAFGIKVKNPIFKEIREEYPDAFEMAVIAAKILYVEYDITFEESDIEYIAIFFGAAIERNIVGKKGIKKKIAIICAFGTGVSQLIAVKIGRFFPDCTVTGVYSVYRLNELILDEPDLIVSTIPINKQIVEHNIPIIQVSSLFVKQDVENMGKAFGYMEAAYDFDGKELLAGLFTKDLFLKDIDLNDRTSVIKFMCDALYKQGIADVGIEQLVLEREKISSTAMGNLVAIPHALVKNQCDSHIVVGTLKKPVNWGGEDVKLVLLLIFEETSLYKYKAIYKELYDIISNKNKIYKLIQVGDFPNFIRCLKEAWL